MFSNNNFSTFANIKQSVEQFDYDYRGLMNRYRKGEVFASDTCDISQMLLTDVEWQYRYNPFGERESKYMTVNSLDQRKLRPMEYYLLGPGNEQFAVYNGFSIHGPATYNYQYGNEFLSENIILDSNKKYIYPSEYNVYSGEGVFSSYRLAYGVAQKNYFIYNHLGSKAVEVDSAGNIIDYVQYSSFGEPLKKNNYQQQWNERLGYIDKEKDRESKLGDHGVRKYDYKIGRFTSVDPLFEKFHGWSPYNYSFNNPINFKDINGKDAVAIVNGDNITIKANYNVSNYSADQISAMGAEINNFLNNQNYVVSTGDYAGKNVKFDLIFFEAGTGGEFTIPQDVQGINIMNTIDQRPNGTYENVPHNQMNIDFRKTDPRGGQYKVNGGLTRASKDIYMNAAFDNLRNRIHEIFSFFYNNDNGATGIHNYVPGTDMPNQDDIDNMINNESLPKITN